MIYQPLEDSFLLEEQVKKNAKGSVLDMGTGSAIQALAAAKKRKVREVIAMDVQKDVIDFCTQNIKNAKIKFFQSNLFEAFRKNNKYRNKKFDTIIFNPPYLPEEPMVRDVALDGGKKGFEVVQKFIRSTWDYLKDDGIILLLISSLTNKPRVEEILTTNLFEFKILARKHIFFEDLFVYMIQKNRIAQKLYKKGIKELKYFTKGHRGILFTGKYRGKKVIIKSKLPESKAEGRVANEAKWLKKLRKKRIGPNVVMAEKDFFAYRFVEGEFIGDFIANSTKKGVLNVFVDILKQCNEMDRMKIDKEEMHHPYKHILVQNQKPTLIDFERVHKSKSPKNVTQFLQFIGSGYIDMDLRRKRIYMNRKILIRIAREYKMSMDIRPVVKFIQDL